jgi:hypothetical protein
MDGTLNLDLGPATVRHDPNSLAQSNQLIGRNVFEGLKKSIGPVNFQIHKSCGAKAEMQTGIIARIKAGLAQRGLSLCFRTITR